MPPELIEKWRESKEKEANVTRPHVTVNSCQENVQGKEMIYGYWGQIIECPMRRQITTRTQYMSNSRTHTHA